MWSVALHGSEVGMFRPEPLEIGISRIMDEHFMLLGPTQEKENEERRR